MDIFPVKIANIPLFPKLFHEFRFLDYNDSSKSIDP